MGREVSFEPDVESTRVGEIVSSQQLYYVGSHDKDYGMAVLLDLLVRLHVHIAGCHEDAELPMSQARNEA